MSQTTNKKTKKKLCWLQQQQQMSKITSGWLEISVDCILLVLLRVPLGDVAWKGWGYPTAAEELLASPQQGPVLAGPLWRALGSFRAGLESVSKVDNQDMFILVRGSHPWLARSGQPSILPSLGHSGLTLIEMLNNAVLWGPSRTQINGLISARLGQTGHYKHFMLR